MVHDDLCISELKRRIQTYTSVSASTWHVQHIKENNQQKNYLILGLKLPHLKHLLVPLFSLIFQTAIFFKTNYVISDVFLFVGSGRASEILRTWPCINFVLSLQYCCIYCFVTKCLCHVCMILVSCWYSFVSTRDFGIILVEK